MPTLVTSPRALVAALVPLSALHLFAVPLIAASGDGQRFSTPDAILTALATRLAVEATAFVALHLLAKWGGISRRSAYAGIGSAAAVAGYALTVSLGWWPRLASEGATITTGLAPAVAGALAGVLYYQVAGIDWGPAGRSGLGVQAEPGSEAARAAYTGPLQVRTSATAFILTALAPSLLCGLVMLPVLFNSLVGLNAFSPKPLRTGQNLLGYATPLYVMLLGIPSTAVPAALFVWAGHALARAFNRIDYRAYALAGAAVAAGVPFLLSGGRLGIAVLPFALLGAAVMTTYRRLAGLEPKPLPEHVVVRNAEALVPAADPRRHEHRVLYGG